MKTLFREADWWRGLRDAGVSPRPLEPARRLGSTDANPAPARAPHPRHDDDVGRSGSRAPCHQGARQEALLARSANQLVPAASLTDLVTDCYLSSSAWIVTPRLLNCLRGTW